ncbi:ferredoxin reductase family protein [Halarcobacter anaerophilus]|uniref:Ferric reductase n=1 Tax=Halarcobacter anaerophilus TaxID=877500 RepID=A0A4Q0Y372_9BACT|nr:ferric reductase-like transmembrane domain-containing protein [Halarcobacter anaerophilus]QDF29323.1 ferric reductase [Halarcobacter anaerophilus]RXJ64570.1 ferric reductase [Halarcobacter anaerophilus]
MKYIKILFLSLLVLLTVLWLAADTLIPEPFTYFSFRSVFVQYSGVVATGLMSVAMLLALRPKFIEPYLDGMDKMYRLHKWLGITAFIFAIAHWWFAKGTKWMVGWGWLEKPVRKGGDGKTLSAVENWFHAQKGFAESVGEWAFYAALILVVLALVKYFPYHWFVKTHKLIALAYLAFVYHSVILMKIEYWSQPVGWLMALLLLGGTVAAILTLTGRIGINRKLEGTISQLKFYPALRVLETTIVMDKAWKGHTAGQFAFVTTDKKEGAHPYTIASAWSSENRELVFITKALGDHTSRLKDKLKKGMSVTVEGPYGCFDFKDEQPRQIWVGAGIGITPFIAKLKQRAKVSDDKIIDLFHTTSDFDESALEQLTSDAKAAGVNLHLLVSSKDGRLNAERIRTTVPKWESSSIWFCGPQGFGQALREDFISHDLPSERFHQEIFQMR